MEFTMLTYGDIWDGNIISRSTAESVRYQSFGKRIYHEHKWWKVTDVHMRDNAQDPTKGTLVAEAEEE